MLLEQAHKGIVHFPYDSSLPPRIEDVREIKICELCSHRFLRTIHLEEDENGVKHIAGSTLCNGCAEKNQHEIMISERDKRATQEIQNELKENIQRYRRVGAPHELIICKEKHRACRTLQGWRAPLYAEFKTKGKLLRADIQKICGTNSPGIITMLKKAGFPIIVIGTTPSPHRTRPLNLYALENQ